MQFKWRKRGLVFSENEMPSWAVGGALTPTPIVIDEERVRVFCGFRDSEGISRIGYVDLSALDPRQILGVSQTPVLDVGRPGCFDDNGVILGDVVRGPDGQFRMYYVGFQLVKNAKFLAFTGLATSTDCEVFTRVSEAPVLDRSDGANMIRAIHSARFEDGEWRVWYAAGDGWEKIGGTDYPQYNIWHTSSEDGVNFGSSGELCVDNQGSEYRIGRPSVYLWDDKYVMFYTKGSKSGLDYFPGVAFSENGVVWQRQDSRLGLALGENGEFDSRHLCYPRMFTIKGKTWSVYNGNDMGKEGFGLMELID